jgi:lysozyme family protein
MSQFQPAVEYLFAHTGGYREFHGEISNFGITIKMLSNKGMRVDAPFIRNISKLDAEKIYQDECWEPLPYKRIPDQRIANKIFLFGASGSSRVAFQLLQQAINDCGAKIPVDGNASLRMFSALGRCSPGPVLLALQKRALVFYERLADSRPELNDSAIGWMTRATCSGEIGGCAICAPEAAK